MQPTLKGKIKLAVVLLIVLFAAFLSLNGMRVGKYVVHPSAAELSQRAQVRAAMSAEYALGAADAGAVMPVLRARLRAAGFEDAVVAKLGADRVRAEIAGDDASVLRALGTAGHVEFRDPSGNVVLDRTGFASAVPTYSADIGGYMLTFALNEKGTQAFASATTRLEDQYIAVYLDGEEISAPTIGDPILDGMGQIPFSSATTPAETRALAEKLAMAIMGGELSEPLEVVEVLSLSAPLGRGVAGNAGLALGAGFLLALAFLIFLYRRSGAAAALGLVICAVAALALIYEIDTAVLDAWGVAGLFASLVVALLSQVSVLDRVRAELLSGRGTQDAVKLGFKAALPAILDAHISVGLVAVLLITRGAGSVTGLARALMVGLSMSLCTSAFLTRFLLRLFAGAGFTARAERPELPLFRKARWSLAALALLVVLAVALQLLVGGLGADFAGGTLLRYSPDGDYDRALVQTVFERQFGRAAQATDVDAEDPRADFVGLLPATGDSKKALLTAALGTELGDSDPEEVAISGNLGGAVGDIVLPLLLGLLLALIYLAVRFGIAAPLAALAAIAFDVVIAGALTLVLGARALYAVEAPAIAALIAVAGMSLAGAAVFFGRVREIRRGPGRLAIVEIAERAMAEGANAHIYALIMALCVPVFLAVLRSDGSLAVALIAGVLSACYASMPLAAKLWTWLFPRMEKGAKKAG